MVRRDTESRAHREQTPALDLIFLSYGPRTCSQVASTCRTFSLCTPTRRHQGLLQHRYPRYFTLHTTALFAQCGTKGYIRVLRRRLHPQQGRHGHKQVLIRHAATLETSRSRPLSSIVLSQGHPSTAARIVGPALVVFLPAYIHVTQSMTCEAYKPKKHQFPHKYLGAGARIVALPRLPLLLLLITSWATRHT